MAKANRKRSNKPKPKVEKVVEPPKKTIYEMFPAKTLSQDDANRLKEIFTLSNNVSAFMRDYAEKDITIVNMRIVAKKILEEKQPLQVNIAKNVSRTERDYKKVSEEIEAQAIELEKSLGLLKGQIEHRYEDYLSTLVRHERFISGIIGVEQNKTITGHRSDAKTKVEEEVLFEKDFDKLTDDDKIQLNAINDEIKKQKVKKDVK